MSIQPATTCVYHAADGSICGLRLEREQSGNRRAMARQRDQRIAPAAIARLLSDQPVERRLRIARGRVPEHLRRIIDRWTDATAIVTEAGDQSPELAHELQGET